MFLRVLFNISDLFTLKSASVRQYSSIYLNRSLCHSLYSQKVAWQVNHTLCGPAHPSTLVEYHYGTITHEMYSNVQTATSINVNVTR